MRAPKAGSGSSSGLGASFLFLCLAFLLCALQEIQVRAVAEESTPAFVGSSACAQCHEGEHAAWVSSHHALAMQPANGKTVLGQFDGAVFDRDSAKSVFSREGESYFVRTAGPDGALGDFKVKYAFGVFPLQQYLLELPGGRLQAFGIAWDARPAARGGQRWYDLYLDRKLAPGDPLHWTDIDQNWNYQCAWCHTTNLRKNYDPATKAFDTKWSELGVGCESCHGPASGHLAWARKSEAQRQDSPKRRGFAIALDERRGVTWPVNERGQAARSHPRESNGEILVCASCHSRRGQFSDNPKSVTTFYDAFRPAFIEAPLYFADGQQREEDYNFASFLQSRMYAAGVTCSDCHDPHSGKLRATGDETCAQCHAPTRFAQTTHHHHATGSAGAGCAACHMPTTNYMGVHARHDHSIRIPRPDRTLTLHSPNACNNCHSDKSAEWAAAAMKSWNVEKPAGFQSFAEAFDLADRDAPGARAALVAVIEDADQSSMVRASAIVRFARHHSSQSMQLATTALSARDPLLRLASVSVIAQTAVPSRIKLLAPALNDSSRVVRMEAARALAGEAEKEMSDKERDAFEAALREYVDAQLFNAERGESHANLGTLYAARGRIEQGRLEYETALELDRSFFPAAIALAELARNTGDEAAAEAVLRKSLAANPSQGALHHALGLSLIRQERRDEALSELEQAVRFAPADARFAYVRAVALHDLGQPEQAMTVLRNALTRSPNDVDVLSALASYEIERGEFAAARSRADALVEIDPDNEDAQQLLRALKREPR